MKKFLLIAALALSSAAMAAGQSNPVDMSGLSKDQLLQLAQQAEAMKKETVKDPVSISANVRNEAEAWGSLGANMGKAMVGAAKEVGIAANDFASTDLGKITVGLVAYKLVGKELISTFVGFFILIFGSVMALWMLLTKRWSDVRYEYVPVLWGAFQKRRVLESKTSGDVLAGKLIGAAVCFFICMLVGLKTMF
jgi:hypothetical protein